MHPGKLGVWLFTDGQSAVQSAEFIRKLDDWGYSAFWMPEALGRHPFAHAAWLLANSERITVATGIASIYNRDPGTTMAAARTLLEQSAGRFLLGLGVSHAPMVEGVRGHQYGRPVATMRAYLDAMKKMPYLAVGYDEEPTVVLAALGPNMLALARDAAAGAHPYFTTPEHTRQAREILGEGPLLCVEQKVILHQDKSTARALARQAAAMYLSLPNYRNNWQRMGFTPADFDDGGSDRFIDATFAWGNIDSIRLRLEEHWVAGADHVAVQPINPNGIAGDPDYGLLEDLARTMTD